tara:strand:+ start:1014 stop:1145 length:132 start_codon:yes stop_codon:yes gene_type:complete
MGIIRQTIKSLVHENKHKKIKVLKKNIDLPYNTDHFKYLGSDF